MSLLRTAVASEIIGAQIRAVADYLADAPADLVGQPLLAAEQQGFIPAGPAPGRPPAPINRQPPANGRTNRGRRRRGG